MPKATGFNALDAMNENTSEPHIFLPGVSFLDNLNETLNHSEKEEIKVEEPLAERRITYF